jgi:hypothetical protein
MKYLWMVVFLVLSLTANATNQQGAQALAGAVSISSGGSGGEGGNGGGASINEKRQPVSSAIAPAVSISEQCPVIALGGHAVQFFGFGGSTTGVVQVNSFCAALMLKQLDLAQQILCDKNPDYKAAALKQGYRCN